MAELHLDGDEWRAILHSMKCEYKLVKDEPKQDLYAKYIASIILKIEVAVGWDDSEVSTS